MPTVTQMPTSSKSWNLLLPRMLAAFTYGDENGASDELFVHGITGTELSVTPRGILLPSTVLSSGVLAGEVQKLEPCILRAPRGTY